MPTYRIWPEPELPDGIEVEARDPYSAAKQARADHPELAGDKLVLVPLGFVTVTRKPLGGRA